MIEASEGTWHIDKGRDYRAEEVFWWWLECFLIIPGLGVGEHTLVISVLALGRWGQEVLELP